MWNSNELIPPPTNTCMIKSHSLDINVLQRVSRESCGLLKATKVLEMEHQLLSRCIYKLKLQFRNDKALKLMIIVNKSLKTCIGFNMDKDISHFFESIPNTYKNYSYFPSQQMLDYLLVRMQGYSKILCRTAECSITVAEYMNSRLKLGHFVALTIFILCVVSRIWQVCKTFILNVCSWYNSLLPLRKTLQLCGVPWLTTDYQFPEDLFEWLKAEWLYDTPFLLTKLQIELPIFTLLDETEDEVQFVNQYKLDNFFVIDDDNSDDNVEFRKKQHSASIIHISEDKSDVEIVSDVENDENLVCQTKLQYHSGDGVQRIDVESETVPISDEDVGESISRDLLNDPVSNGERVDNINKTDIQEMFNSSTSDVEIIECANETLSKSVLKYPNDVKTIHEIDNAVSHNTINNVEIIEILDKQIISESELSKNTQTPSKEKTITSVSVSKSKTKKKVRVRNKEKKIHYSKDISSSTEDLTEYNENVKDKASLKVTQTPSRNNDMLGVTKSTTGKKKKRKTNKKEIGLNSSIDLSEFNTKNKRQIEEKHTKKKLTKRNSVKDSLIAEVSYDDVNNEKNKSLKILNHVGNSSFKLVTKPKQEKIKKLKSLTKKKRSLLTENNKKKLLEKETSYINKNLGKSERTSKRSIGVSPYNNAKIKQKLSDKHNKFETTITTKNSIKLPKTSADLDVINIVSDNSVMENSNNLNFKKTKNMTQLKCSKKSDTSLDAKKKGKKIKTILQNFVVSNSSGYKNQTGDSSSETSVVENKKKKTKSSNNSFTPKSKKRKLEENTLKGTSDSEDSASIQNFTSIHTSVSKRSRKRKLSTTEVDSSSKSFKKTTSAKDSDLSVISLLDESCTFSSRKLFPIKKRNLRSKSNKIKKLMNTSVWSVSDTDSSTIIN